MLFLLERCFWTTRGNQSLYSEVNIINIYIKIFELYMHESLLTPRLTNISQINVTRFVNFYFTAILLVQKHVRHNISIPTLTISQFTHQYMFCYFVYCTYHTCVNRQSNKIGHTFTCQKVYTFESGYWRSISLIIWIISLGSSVYRYFDQLDIWPSNLE